jgi:hypothetical protein
MVTPNLSTDVSCVLGSLRQSTSKSQHRDGSISPVLHAARTQALDLYVRLESFKFFAFRAVYSSSLSDSDFHPHDFFSISHVSKFWRFLVLDDKRWNQWFDVRTARAAIARPDSLDTLQLISTESGGTAAAFLSRHKVLDMIPKRYAFQGPCFQLVISAPMPS